MRMERHDGRLVDGRMVMNGAASRDRPLTEVSLDSASLVLNERHALEFALSPVPARAGDE